ncbi:hypothetical protein CDAR_35411 [Caerostris darwini]|uniref:Uncharacterized protein n=1 Tax=Caerostris darwini TaxID=1538125 RepID=A0AAV4SRZ0_9ARAC|nr:hypothetical protein CDAR_35411 [Caerostris darwini]
MCDSNKSFFRLGTFSRIHQKSCAGALFQKPTAISKMACYLKKALPDAFVRKMPAITDGVTVVVVVVVWRTRVAKGPLRFSGAHFHVKFGESLPAV